MSLNLFLDIGNYLLLGMFVYLVVSWRKSRPEGLFHALLSSLIAWTITAALKEIFPSPRPFIANGLIPEGFNPASSSFPSGHAATAFALGVSAFMHDGLVGALMLGASLAVGATRMLGNVHYPVDILGGAVIGTLTAYFSFRFHLPKRRP